MAEVTGAVPPVLDHVVVKLDPHSDTGLRVFMLTGIGSNRPKVTPATSAQLSWITANEPRVAAMITAAGG